MWQAHIKQIRKKFFCSHKMAELPTEWFYEFCSLYGSILFLAPSGCRTLLVKSGTSYFKVYVQFWDFNSLETWRYTSVAMRGMTWIAMIRNLWRRGRHGAKSVHGGHQFLNIAIAHKVWPCPHSFRRIIEDCFLLITCRIWMVRKMCSVCLSRNKLVVQVLVMYHQYKIHHQYKVIYIGYFKNAHMTDLYKEQQPIA
jgi:hypothetical protein